MKYRVDFGVGDHAYLVSLLRDVIDRVSGCPDMIGLDEGLEELLAKMLEAKIIHDGKKAEGAEKARKRLMQQTKAKVENAVNLLRMEGKEITPYRVAQTAGISYNTAKKYLVAGPGA